MYMATMPVAPVHEYSDTRLRKNNIDLSPQTFQQTPVKSISKP